MGVPLYFKHLVMNNDDIILKLNDFDNTKKINLYFDFNGLIHQASQLSENKIVKEIFINVKNYFLKILNLFTNINQIYICIDGIAPMSKVNQQRGRRYKSVLMKEQINKIKENYDMKIDNWDSNCISPGTEFMNNLSIYLKSLLNTDFKEYNIVVSDSDDIGEGEQKIFKYIENHKNEINIIYGLDADLIMLSLVSNIDNIYLLRENNKDYVLLKIDSLKKNINENNNQEYIINYIFIFFLFGNDFIPNLNCLLINNHTIKLVLEIYKECKDCLNYNLINEETLEINYNFFILFLSKIKDIQQKILINNENYYYKLEYKEKKNLEEFDSIIDKLNSKPLLDKCKNEIMYRNENWEYRYYKYYTNFDINEDKCKIDQMCYEYVYGLNNILHYYINHKLDNKWFYKYRCAPLIDDLISFLNKKNIINIEIKEIDYNTTQQLLYILPPQSNNLLPEEYKKIVNDIQSNILDLYPKYIELDSFLKKYQHETLPILPYLDNNRIDKEYYLVSSS